MDAHLCPNGGRIRKYPAFLCSMCMTRGAIDLVMSEQEIDAYNNEVGTKNRSEGTKEQHT